MANIVLVDDDILIQNIIASMLKQASHQVRCASHGEEAAALLREKEPDILITDIVMPKKSGITLITETIENYPNLSIIAMSGGGRIDSNSYLDLSKRLGATITLQKPIQNDVLLKTIAKLMAKK